MPTGSQVHVNTPLTNMSLAVLQKETSFAAVNMFPVVRVVKSSDIYFEYKREDFLRNGAKVRADASPSAGGDYGLDQRTYTCQPLAFHKDIGERERNNSDSPLRPDQDAMKFVTRQLLIGREVRFGSNFFTTGIWSTQKHGVAGVPGAGEFRQWSDYTNSTPLLDVESWFATMEDLTGFRPNKMLVGRDVHAALKNHPTITDRAKLSPSSTAPNVVTPALLAALFEVEMYQVARGIYNTSAVPGTPSYSQILGAKSVLFVFAPNEPAIAEASAGYTFVNVAVAGANEAGIRILKEPVPNCKADRIEGELEFDMKVVCADLGVFGYDSVA